MAHSFGIVTDFVMDLFPIEDATVQRVSAQRIDDDRDWENSWIDLGGEG